MMVHQPIKPDIGLVIPVVSDHGMGFLQKFEPPTKIALLQQMTKHPQCQYRKTNIPPSLHFFTSKFAETPHQFARIS
jgi:hypothetical protein